jgi:hypothetical protein
MHAPHAPPPRLQHVERDAPADDGANERDHERHEVHGELELQELADGVEHAAAPQHSPVESV